MTSSDNHFSFIVPCFNEEVNIANTVNSIINAVPRNSEYEIILVDDCSTDDTFNTMLDLAKTNSSIKVLKNSNNIGFGGSYKRGLKDARGTHVMMLPGDDGFPTESIAKVLSHVNEKDIIVAVVVNNNSRSFLRFLLSTTFTKILNLIFRLNISYYNGATLQRNNLIQEITIKTDSFAYQAEAIVKLVSRGATYLNCPVTIRARKAGRSSALKLKNQVNVIRAIWGLVVEVGIFKNLNKN